MDTNNFSANIQKALTEAYSNVQSQINSDTTVGGLYTALSAELTAMGDAGSEALQKILNEGQATIVSMYATLGEEEASLA